MFLCLSKSLHLDSSKWLASAATTRLVFSLPFHTPHQPPSSPRSQRAQPPVRLTVLRPNVPPSIIRTRRTSMGRRACQFTRQQPSRAWVASTTILALGILLAATLVRHGQARHFFRPHTLTFSPPRTPSRKNILCSTCLHCLFRNGCPRRDHSPAQTR
jgi:hypothetical protein